MNILSKIIKKDKKNETTQNEKKERNVSEGIVSTKDIIAPGSIEVDFNNVRIDNRYYRTLFVASYPRFVGINWLSSLINFDSSLDISMFIYPTDGKQILDDLRRKITEMEAEINTNVQKGKMADPATQAKLEDAMNLQEDLVKGQERFFQFGLYITISGESIAELDRINKNLEASLGSLMIITKKATLQMEDGFKTTLPLCKDKLNISRNMDTTSLATTFPFVSSDLSDDKGIMYGINEHNGSLVIFDRFSMPNYNSIVLATAGAGKSYLVKLESIRSLMFGAEIIIIDPENEYKDLCEAYGGQYVAFGYNEASKINPMDLSLTKEEGENALNSKVLTLHQLFKVMLGKMAPIEDSILDKAIMEAYKSKGISQDIETQKKDAPLFEDLYKILLGNEDEKSKSLAARLEKYIKGSFAGIFNQKTNINLKNNFVVFGIKNLEESLRPVAMQIILDYIWTIVKKTLKKRILVVDEAWYLMQYKDSAEFLRGIVKRGRKYYLGVTTITQDVDDFLKTSYGKEIITNSSIQILLKQHSAAINLIGETFYLSQGERQLLLSADKGEGIFFADPNHVAIRVIASEEENKLITSDPEEILRMKKKNDEIVASIKTEPKKTVETVKTDKITNSVKETKPPEPMKPPEPIEKIEPVKMPEPVKSAEPIKVPEVNEKTEEEVVIPILQRRINEMENKNKEETTKFQQEREKEIQQKEEEKKNFDTKFKELFKGMNEIKNDQKTEEKQSEESNKKEPVFVKQEVNIPQPPQLQKKPQPVFEQKDEKQIKSIPFAKIPLEKKPVDVKTGKLVEETKKDEQKKTDYDDLFGNGIV
jgi:conjugal transfer ATP-binding protein TraC